VPSVEPLMPSCNRCRVHGAEGFEHPPTANGAFPSWRPEPPGKSAPAGKALRAWPQVTAIRAALTPPLFGT
jgi:hypothetical protein